MKRPNLSVPHSPAIPRQSLAAISVDPNNTPGAGAYCQPLISGPDLAGREHFAITSARHPILFWPLPVRYSTVRGGRPDPPDGAFLCQVERLPGGRESELNFGITLSQLAWPKFQVTTLLDRILLALHKRPRRFKWSSAPISSIGDGPEDCVPVTIHVDTTSGDLAAIANGSSLTKTIQGT